MKQFRSFVIAALAVATLALLPRGTAAQQEITVDFAGGIAVPTGDISDAVDAGPAFTIGLDLPVHEIVSIRVGGGADFWSGKEIDNGFAVLDGPDLTHTRLNAGIVLHAVEPTDDQGAWVDADIGGSYNVVTTERFERQTGPNDVTEIDISSGYIGAKGGVSVGYKFSDQVSAFVGGDVHLTFADEDDFADYSDLGVEPPSSIVSIPLQAGLKFHFQP